MKLRHSRCCHAMHNAAINTTMCNMKWLKQSPRGVRLTSAGLRTSPQFVMIAHRFGTTCLETDALKQKNYRKSFTLLTRKGLRPLHPQKDRTGAGIPAGKSNAEKHGSRAAARAGANCCVPVHVQKQRQFNETVLSRAARLGSKTLAGLQVTSSKHCIKV